MRRLLLTLLAPLMLAVALIASDGAEAMALDRGWEYRWGDSPLLADGTPAWIAESQGDDAWQPIAFPANPPERDGRRNAWFRVTLPEGEWRDPVLYIDSVDLITRPGSTASGSISTATSTPTGREASRAGRGT